MDIYTTWRIFQIKNPNQRRLEEYDNQDHRQNEGPSMGTYISTTPKL